MLAAFVRAEGGKQVVAGQAFVPEVLYEGNYYPICGHHFWDNKNGATTICKALGFAGGTKQLTRTKYTLDAMPVGECKADEPLDKCTGAWTTWGDFDWSGKRCNKGNDVGVTVTCTGE